MKIVIISAIAPPEPMCIGQVHWDIAKHLAEENNEVYLISPFPSRPLGAQYVNDKSDKVTQIGRNFVHVNVNAFRYPKYNLNRRVLESFDFGIKSIRYVNNKIKDYDLIYVSPWAFVGHLMILILRKNKKARFIMNIQDLYPESFFLKIHYKTMVKLLKPLYWIDWYIAKHSSHITVISESLKQVYIKKRKIPESKITVLYNWQDENEFLKPLIPKEEIIEKYKLKAIIGKFVYMFLGNIGPVAGVETIIKAFGELENKNSAMIIAGSGSDKERCRLLADILKTSDIHFLEVPLGLIPVIELQSISDILMLPIIPNAAKSSIPSKLIAYMFSRKPIITSADVSSETASAIIASKCGWVTKSNETSEWRECMKRAYETSEIEINEMGRSGFDYAMRYYSKQQGLIRVTQLFQKLLNN